MKESVSRSRRMWREDGQSLLEYGFMAAFVVFAASAVMSRMAHFVQFTLRGIDVDITTSTIRIVSSVLAAAFLGLIVLCRRSSSE